MRARWISLLATAFIAMQPLMAAEKSVGNMPESEAGNATTTFSSYVISHSKPNTLITAPSSAIVTRNGIPGVFLFQGGMARFAMVKTGKTHGGNTEILSGLMAGDTVILGQQEQLGRLHDGSAVALK